MGTLLRTLAISLTILALAIAGPVGAQSNDKDDPLVVLDDSLILRSVRTDSPRDTLESFLRVRDDFARTLLAYRDGKSFQLASRIVLLGDQARALIDLSEFPTTTRRERSEEAGMALMDIFGRIAPPTLEDVPNSEAIADLTGPVSWRIPQTPIRIVKIQDGPRQGEFLFSAQTTRDGPRFFRGIEDLPLTPPMPFDSWTDMSRQLTGPLVPAWLVDLIPTRLLGLWLDTPVWKVLLVIILDGLVIIILLLAYKWLRRLEPEDRLRGLIFRMSMPISVLIITTLLLPTAVWNINLSGRAADIEEAAGTMVAYFALAWFFWLAIRAVFEGIIKSPRISDESYDANMLRLFSGMIGVTGIIVILAFGGQNLGLPVMSLLAGLGIGGLAVALAIRPTLENLIGGIVLYIDKPVRVGDFCTFGEQMGTIESIGIRSTEIRALDRTLISVPNAQFADMQLINWARCDQMLIDEVVGVRYETTADQLRYVLAKIREMLHRHPRIDPQTIRVRFAGYGDSSLNIAIRIYAQTREWNDFFAIREDVFLRIYDIITEAGSGFAFPSHTVYMGNDDGLDETARDAAVDQVKSWRRSGRLPFPRLSEERQEKLSGTLDYPPRGSFEASGEELDSAGGERLSSEPIDPDEVDENEDKEPTSR